MFLVWTFFYGIFRFQKKKYSLLPIFVTGALFGISIEILQYFLPTNRHAEFLDIGADLLGTGLAILLLYLLLKKVPEFKKKPT
jgi:VanZ family protein